MVKNSSKTPSVRPKIPSATRQAVLLEAGYKCANPSCRHILTLELHHIVWVKDGGGNQPENLLPLCPNCHSLHTAGHIPADAINAWKSLLVSLNNPNRASVDLLLLLYQEEQRIVQSENKEDQISFRFTGDGLPVLSSLIISGLVSISRRFSGLTIMGMTMPNFEVKLTEAGKMLVQAWLDGDPGDIKRALSYKNDFPTDSLSTTKKNANS